MKKLSVLGSLFVLACGSGSAKGPAAAAPDGSSAADGLADAAAPALNAGLDALAGFSDAAASESSACLMAAAAPCGGNLVGKWDYYDQCFDDPALKRFISNSTSYIDCALSASITFGGYGMFASDGKLEDHETLVIVMNHDQACMAKRYGMTCEQIDSKCGAQQGKCVCRSTVADVGQKDRYVLTATGYDTGDIGGKLTGHLEYCVQGDTLTIFEPDSAIGGSGRMVMTRAAAALDASVPDSKPADAAKLDAGADKPAADASKTDVSSLDSKAVDASNPDFSADAIQSSLAPTAQQACSMISGYDCGGGMAGDWIVVGLCDLSMTQQRLIDKYSVNKSCSRSADFVSSAYAKFRADGTFEMNEDGHRVAVSYDEACLASAGSSCAKSGTQCSSSGGMCRCLYPFNSPWGTQKGTYEASGGMFFQTNYGEGKSPGRLYCSRGGVLAINAYDMNFELKSAVVMVRSSADGGIGSD